MNNNATEYKRIYKQYRSILLSAYDYYQTLSIDDIDLLMLYKNFEYKVYNGLMGRGDYLLTEDDIPYQQAKQEARRLSEIILNAPKTKEDMVVYRGTDVEFQKKRGTLNEYRTPVITSVSLLSEVSQRFIGDKTCCMYRIHIPAGTPVFPTIYLQSFVENYDREERRIASKSKTKKGKAKISKNTLLTGNTLRDTEIDYEWELLIAPYTELRRDRVLLEEIQRPLYSKKTLSNRVFDEEQNVYNIVRSTKHIYGQRTVRDTIILYEYTITGTPTMENVAREIGAIRPKTVSLDYALAKQLLRL